MLILKSFFFALNSAPTPYIRHLPPKTGEGGGGGRPNPPTPPPPFLRPWNEFPVYCACPRVALAGCVRGGMEGGGGGGAGKMSPFKGHTIKGLGLFLKV